MVSFWPWKGNDNSPASFEKALSTLSAKISKATSRLDGFRTRSRRLKVLWTLYAGFGYLIYTIILVLVVGWRNWGMAEYAAVAGGPLIIFLVRLGLTSYYDYRISSIQGHLDELKKQRDTTIKKLKAATKYDSTLELIKRYSGSPIPKTKPGASERRTTSKQGDTGATKGGRTMFVPPATANIPGRTGPPIDANSPQEPPKPQNRSSRIQSSAAIAASSVQMPLSPLDLSADFAPNAFLAPSQYAQADDGPRWYDRIMDVLLGEDETSPRNRLALICSNCRLVNGQAPPGVKRLEDLGKWRCGGCGIMNGEESEAKRIVASLKERTTSEKEQSSIEEDDDHNSGVGNTKQTKAPAFDGDESDGVRYSSGSSAESAAESEATDDLKQRVAEPETPRRRSTRQKASGKQIT